MRKVREGRGGGGRGALTLDNDDCVLAHNIIHPIQYLFRALDLPKALVHGSVLDVDHLPIACVRKSNGGSAGSLARHPGVLQGHLVALQGLFADASFGKILQDGRVQRLKIVDLGLLNLIQSNLFAFW